MNYDKVIDILKKEKLLIDSNKNDMCFSYISYNSLDIEDNTLFFCKGYNFKKEYLLNAIKKGAICYVSDVPYEVDIPLILVSDVRKSMAIIAKEFYNNIDDSLCKIGITGTKGKTTTTYFIHNIFDIYEKKRTPYISTIDYYTGKSEEKSHNTTPDSIELYRMLNEIKSSNFDKVVMEVSSQAYNLNRIYGMKFAYGCFLNIGLDHIAPHEHKNYKEYLDCKLGFLKKCQNTFVYRNIDDFNYIKEELKNNNMQTFGYTSDCDFIIKNIRQEDGYTKFQVEHNNIIEDYAINISGDFNCINACCAIAIAKNLDIPYEDICKGLFNTFVPGRMNIYNNFVCPVIVDYAHNRLSIENLFLVVKKEYPNCNLKVVVGCPGEKAFNRRYDVADLCGKYAKYVYLTAEDPGVVSVNDICNEIVSYLKPYKVDYTIIEDREKAIVEALNNANENDVIVIIGKGDETYQLIGREYIPYKSDLKIVEEELSKIVN